MIAASRKHGAFDLRWPGNNRVQHRVAVESGSPSDDALDWRAFRERHAETHRRHDLAALCAYATYRREHSDRSDHASVSPQPAEGDWESEGGALPASVGARTIGHD
jgi:hypothetical protein